MTAEPDAPPLPIARIAIVCAAVFLIGMSIVWAFFSMRAVMDIGGACADGGPYANAQPCPDGTWLIAIAIPLMLLSAFAGSAAALSVGAPNLLLPMWFLLFASLGANFLDYGFWSDPWEWGFIVCGVVFELMAFPALFVMTPLSSFQFPEVQQREQRKLARQLADRGLSASPRATRLWWLAYLALVAVGATVGWLVWDALR